jgi:D-glycero-beta-D-manno-heptose-7-phosphate kinase
MTSPRPAPLDPARAEALVANFAGAHILVVGDVMLDRFIVGHVTRISPEAPVPIVRFESEHVRLGGAANVAHNIVALGGRVSVVGVIGGDQAGERLIDAMKAAGVDTGGLVGVGGRPTTEKVRVVTERNQQVARIDYEDDRDVPDVVERSLVRRIITLGASARALLVSDYLKGVVTQPILAALLEVQRASGTRIPLIVDPKIPHLASYAGATLVTPNHAEAEAATHLRIRSDDDARAAAAEFRTRAKCDAVAITRGEHGMWLSADGTDAGIPAIAREVADVTGAGDTVIATLALAMAAGASLVEAAILASHAAGIVVGKFGPATLTGKELVASVNSGFRIQNS